MAHLAQRRREVCPCRYLSDGYALALSDDVADSLESVESVLVFRRQKGIEGKR